MSLDRQRFGGQTGIDPKIAARISDGKEWEPLPDDIFVIDGVAHTYNHHPDNLIPGSYAPMMTQMLWGIHEFYTPRDQPRWLVPKEHRIMQDADLIGHSLFGESQVDACVYHHLPIFNLFKDGGGPLYVGKEMRDRWPGRVLIYGGISPYHENVIDQIDRLLDEEKVAAFKFYPLDLVGGKVLGTRMDDEKLMFPLYEHMLKRGIKTVAMHKAIPFGNVGHEYFMVDDVNDAATSFPDMNFEVFHGGFAFLEDTVLKMTYNSNVTINLEGTSALIFYAPERLAHILGSLAQAGAADRIVWGTGVPVIHPQPFLEAFWNFQIPASMQEGYAYSALTPEIKRLMLGGTQARILNLDIEKMKKVAATDEFANRNTLAQPWTSGRAAA